MVASALDGVTAGNLPLSGGRVVQEKPTNYGTKVADVLANFLAGKLSCESNEYFGALATNVT